MTATNLEGTHTGKLGFNFINNNILIFFTFNKVFMFHKWNNAKVYFICINKPKRGRVARTVRLVVSIVLSTVMVERRCSYLWQVSKIVKRQFDGKWFFKLVDGDLPQLEPPVKYVFKTKKWFVDRQFPGLIPRVLNKRV